MSKFTLLLITFFSFSASAASVKVQWVGVVPSTDCSSNPVSNQTKLQELRKKCSSEFKTEHEQQADKKPLVSFDI
ncbi:hypothetical protein [Vibrio owensii]|uniref:hypothetical protein n=1 Tax=Vibrio owensii TaxID=696485 RepID=UPI003DA03DA2